MSEVLVVDCKACGQTIPSPIQMDRASFETATMTGNDYGCPSCGHVATYGKINHRFESTDS